MSDSRSSSSGRVDVSRLLGEAHDSQNALDTLGPHKPEWAVRLDEIRQRTVDLPPNDAPRLIAFLDQIQSLLSVDSEDSTASALEALSHFEDIVVGILRHRGRLI